MNLAERRTSPSPVSIELCTTLDELRECVRLQRAIWNDSDEDLTSSATLMVANKIGGHVLLAKDGARAVGFAFAFPAFRGDVRYLHSHLVGVIPDYQNRGIGLRLKLKQRELALAERIPLMEWTFDPLVIGNAYFNVARLGAIIRRFIPNLYGVTASPLHGGLPTDRLVAEWWLISARVDDALAGRALAGARHAVEIIVPAELNDWKKAGSSQVFEVQARLSEEFQERFASGHAVTAFRIENGNGIYLLERLEN